MWRIDLTQTISGVSHDICCVTILITLDGGMNHTKIMAQFMGIHIRGIAAKNSGGAGSATDTADANIAAAIIFWQDIYPAAVLGEIHTGLCLNGINPSKKITT